MGVNRPSVEALRPDHCGGIRATRDLAGQSKKGSVGRGERTTGITEGEPEELWKIQRVLSRGEGE
jgi:hypothetical protein